MAREWMATARLRELAGQGLTYDQIAMANELAHGWRPSRSGVYRKLQRLGIGPRRNHHDDLIPWRLRPEHNNSRIRHMLQAEGRRRAGEQPSRTDKSLLAGLAELLNPGHGRKPMVIGYDPKIGFFTIERQPADQDIIRQ